jgi:isopenicillin N synthase-like dioxygenase
VQPCILFVEIQSTNNMPPSYSIPILDLSLAEDTRTKQVLLQQLHAALFNVGFLYVTNHGVSAATIDRLTSLLPPLFDLPAEEKAALAKLSTPHFLGYSGFAEETTLGRQDLREQFDFATELPTVWRKSTCDQTSADSTEYGETGHTTPSNSRDFSHLYWRLRGPNQWPKEASLPGFREALTAYHDEVEALSYRFVHLIEEAFGIPVGTFDHFFGRQTPHSTEEEDHVISGIQDFLPPQHRIKLLRYPPSSPDAQEASQGVGAHKDSSGWLTFLYQVGNEEGLEVLSSSGEWLRARPIPSSFVVNFGNAFEAVTEGAVKATIHRVIAPGPTSNVRYSIPFFMGLPLDMTVSEIRRYIPEEVRRLRSSVGSDAVVSDFLDPRWDSLGESQLRKWIRSHREVGEKWYGDVVPYYTQ